MTQAEARQIAQIMATADGECHVCASLLARQAQAQFPEHDWIQLVADAGEWDREIIEARFD